MQCYFRLCGSLKTLSDAHDSALQQTKHAFLSSLQKSSGAIHEASPFSWSAFSSFENMNVAHSDFFIIYCRAVPIEVNRHYSCNNIMLIVFILVRKFQSSFKHAQTHIPSRGETDWSAFRLRKILEADVHS